MAAEPIQTMSTSAIRKRKPDVTGPRVYQAASTKIAHFASCSLRLSGKDVERQARVRLLAVIMVAVTVPRRFAVPGTGAGLLQMAVQFVAKPEWMFPLDMFLPEQLFISQFNLRIPITDSLPYLKGNGLVFLEPSHFSQFLAFSILIELAYFRRLPRLALLGLAYLTSFRDRRDTVVHCCNAAHSAPSTIFNAAIPPLPASCCFLTCSLLAVHGSHR